MTKHPEHLAGHPKCEWPSCPRDATHVEREDSGAFVSYCDEHGVGGG